MEEMGIEAVYQKPNLSRNNKPHPVYPYLLKGVQIVRPNHVWGTDITYIRMRGGYCYLVCFLDWYSRYVDQQKFSPDKNDDILFDGLLNADYLVSSNWRDVAPEKLKKQIPSHLKIMKPKDFIEEIKRLGIIK